MDSKQSKTFSVAIFILRADVDALLETLQETCLALGVDPQSIAESYSRRRQAGIQTLLRNLEDKDPALAAALQEHLDRHQP